jgi:hypothetical protein
MESLPATLLKIMNISARSTPMMARSSHGPSWETVLLVVECVVVVVLVIVVVGVGLVIVEVDA